MSHAAPSAARTILSTLPALLVLLLVVGEGTSELIQARLLADGEAIWPGYSRLRQHPEPPACDPASFDAAPAPSEGADGGVLDALFGDDAAAPEAAPATDVPAADGDVLDALFGDEADDAPTATAGAAPAAQAEGAPSAEGADAAAPQADDDVLGALFGEEAPQAADPGAAARAAAKAECEAEHTAYAAMMASITPTLRAWRSADNALGVITDAGRRYARPALVFLLVLCAATASALRAHIALRPARSRMDHRVAGFAQVAANGLVVASALTHHQVIAEAGVVEAFPWLPLLWAAGFAIMAGFGLLQALRPPADATPGGSVATALLTVPLYATMAFVASFWFLSFEAYPSGLAAYLDKLTVHAHLYLQVGLYVWAGMLLKQTRLAHLTFDVLRPWKMPPELLAIVVVLLAAIPTAYSGASGIFVIAAGAIIFDELRRAGARTSLALASTAMSGSLGVVLAPCLLVVIVASLNNEVTTAELYGAGLQVFALTAGLFVLTVLLTRQNPVTLAPVAEALPAMLSASRGLVPYVGVGAAVILGYGFVLDAWPDEHAAPRILLVLLLLWLVVEGARGWTRPTAPRLAEATTETTEHIGALLALMALSVGFGGVVERSEVMNLLAGDLGGPWPAMALLTAMLVVVGMLMDPYGAVILVSATLAHVAAANGISALHFWMVVLVAFELGYLTPPVALNHLLTRAVVGDAADEGLAGPEAGLWLQHERYLLPVTVMGTALLIVAFGPLLLS